MTKNRYEYIKTPHEGEQAVLPKGIDCITNNTVVFKRRAYQGLGFSTEREILRMVQHENLPVILDSYTENEEEVLVLLYFEGKTLEEHARITDLIEDQILHIFVQVCHVIDYLHNHPKGITHRDITPSNILINDRGHILLIDFDVSSCDAFLKTSEESYGTIEYAAPESILSTEMNGRLADIYGIGACLQRLMKESKEFFSLELNLIVKKAMALNPSDRYKNIQQLKEDLQLLL